MEFEVLFEFLKSNEVLEELNLNGAKIRLKLGRVE